MSDRPKQYVIAGIRTALACDSRVNQLDIEVAVAAGRIFLTGEVATEERKAAISTVLAERFPDYEVENELTVCSLSPPREAETLS